MYQALPKMYQALGKYTGKILEKILYGKILWKNFLEKSFFKFKFDAASEKSIKNKISDIYRVRMNPPMLQKSSGRSIKMDNSFLIVKYGFLYSQNRHFLILETQCYGKLNSPGSGLFSVSWGPSHMSTMINWLGLQ